MEIDLGLDFEKAEAIVAEQRRAPTPGDYTLQCTDIKPGVSGDQSKVPGRPMLNFELSIVNNADFSGKKVFYNTMLPYADPLNGNKLLTSGLGFLVDLTKALGQPWTGGKLRTEDYIGRTCNATLGQEVNPKSGELRAVVNKVWA